MLIIARARVLSYRLSPSHANHTRALHLPSPLFASPPGTPTPSRPHPIPPRALHARGGAGNCPRSAPLRALCPQPRQPHTHARAKTPGAPSRRPRTTALPQPPAPDREGRTRPPVPHYAQPAEARHAPAHAAPRIVLLLLSLRVFTFLLRTA